MNGGHFFLGAHDKWLDQLLEHQPKPPLSQVALGTGRALVKQADNVQQGVLLGGNVPRPMILGFSFGFDIPPHFDQSNQAQEPGAVLQSWSIGKPADAFAEVAGPFGRADIGGEVKPGSCQ